MTTKSLSLAALAAALLTAGLVEAAAPPVSIVPAPRKVEFSSGTVTVGKEVSVSYAPKDNTELSGVAKHTAGWLTHAVGAPVAINNAGEGVRVEFELRDDLGIDSKEGYRLTTAPGKITIAAPTPTGCFYGFTTLRQLFPAEAESKPAGEAKIYELPAVNIEDWPQLPWRGMLFDCGRHFMDKDFVKRYIDLLAYHKMNVLHWHLTEDQGWRIAIDRYPRLTEVGAWRMQNGERYGGFYTKDDIREVVAYAQERFVTVVPEIEMPGHSQAALASYPKLSCTGDVPAVAASWGVFDDVYCAGKEETFEFLQNVLLEVFELFPSKYIHLGGDECPKVRWKACPDCQKRMKDEGIATEEELQGYFLHRMSQFVEKHGRRVIGWDEILEGGVPEDAIVQSWRGMKGAMHASKAGHDVIVSPTSHCYLDYPQGADLKYPNWMTVTPLEKTYSLDPTPEEMSPEQAKHIIGVQGNLWTERVPQQRVDRMVFPRLAALAEVSWTPEKLQSWSSFRERMNKHYARLDALGVEYFIHPPVPQIVEETEEGWTVALRTPVEDGRIVYMLDGSDPQASSTAYTEPLKLNKNATINVAVFLPRGVHSETQSWTLDELKQAIARKR